MQFVLPATFANCPKFKFLLDIEKMCLTRSQVCRTVLIRGALERLDIGVFSDWSNFEIRQLGIDLATFEVTRALNNS